MGSFDSISQNVEKRLKAVAKVFHIGGLVAAIAVAVVILLSSLYAAETPGALLWAFFQAAIWFVCIFAAGYLAALLLYALGEIIFHLKAISGAAPSEEAAPQELPRL